MVLPALTTHGTGAGRIPIRNIEAPLEFRRRTTKVIDGSRRT